MQAPTCRSVLARMHMLRMHMLEANKRPAPPARLHDDGLLGVAGRNELEVLHTGQLHAAAEVEAPAVQALIPVRRLVQQLHAARQTARAALLQEHNLRYRV